MNQEAFFKIALKSSLVNMSLLLIIIYLYILLQRLKFIISHLESVLIWSRWTTKSVFYFTPDDSCMRLASVAPETAESCTEKRYSETGRV